MNRGFHLSSSQSHLSPLAPLRHRGFNSRSSLLPLSLGFTSAMSLSRALTSLLSASSKQHFLRAPVAALHLHLFSTKASQNKSSSRKNIKPSAAHDELKVDPSMNLRNDEVKSDSITELEHDEVKVGPVKKFKRPSEILFQRRVANLVQLTGKVGVPVEKKVLSDGRVAAVSVLIQEKSHHLPRILIPIIFQEELAEVAAVYLKENDIVHVTGELNGDIGPVKVNESQANVQVLAHTLSYVVGSDPDNLKQATDSDAKIKAHRIEEKEDSVSCSEAEITDALSRIELWNDLVRSPNDWYDNRANKMPGKATPDFKHKKTGETLYINNSTPSWVIPKLERPPFSLNNPSSPKWGTTKKTNSLNMQIWDNLVANPQNWVDNRMDKQNGKLKHNFPDFKNKVTKEALWISAAPISVLEQLDRLEFGSGSVSQGKPFTSDGSQTFLKSSTSNGSQTSSKDALWKDLIDNPKKWWDNRSEKLNPKSPDFKHKDTGEALWIGHTTPQWVLEKLPSINMKATRLGTSGADSDVRTGSFKTTLLS